MRAILTYLTYAAWWWLGWVIADHLPPSLVILCVIVALLLDLLRVTGQYPGPREPLLRVFWCDREDDPFRSPATLAGPIHPWQE